MRVGASGTWGSMGLAPPWLVRGASLAWATWGTPAPSSTGRSRRRGAQCPRGREAAMALFDQVLGGLIGQFGSGQQKNSLLNLATSVIQGHPQGLAGIIQQFTN